MLALAGWSAQASARGVEPALPPEQDIPIAILVDMASGQVLHERNADRRFIPASITKTMSVFVALELIKEGQLSPDQRMVFSPASFGQWGGVGSTMFLNANDRLRVADLLRGMTTVSANDASVVLAEGAAGSLEKWAELMNGKARAIGMTQSHFSSPNGWPDEGRTFVTARDLSTLASALIRRHPREYATYFGRRALSYRGIRQVNHDPFSGQVAGGDGLKTGFTNEAGFGFLGSAIRDGRRLVVIVAGAERARLRDRAARAYLEWGFAKFESKPLFSAGDIVGKVRVQGGNLRRIDAVTTQQITAAIPLGTERDIALTVRYDGPVRAPIAKGQKIAELEISVDGMEPSRLPLYAADEVAEAGLFARLANGIVGWLS